MSIPLRIPMIGIAALTSIVIAVPAVSATTLSVVMESRLSVLDPVVSTSHQSRNHGYMIYDTLLAIDANGTIQPQMLENWSVSDEGKTYTFKLRDGLLWHDGQPVTAEDCVASIERWAQVDRMGRALTPMIAEITPVDEKTFSIKLNAPADMILTAFAKPSGIPLFIMPARVAATPAKDPITDYTGSGPFKFIASEFEPGAKVVYEKFDGYLPRAEPASGLAGGKVVKVDRVERIEMSDQLTAVNALSGGEIDYVETIPYDLLPMVESTPGVTLATVEPFGYQVSYRFNHLHPPFDNKLVRQAAVYAIGTDDLFKAQIGNPDYYITCAAVFGCGMPLESESLADMVIPANPGKAKELLKEAGYDGSRVVILQTTDVPTISQMPVVMAQQLREAGFKVDVQAMDFMTMLSRRSNQGPTSQGGWSIFVTAWHNTEISDPVRSATVTANGKDAWAGWPDIPAVTDAIEAYAAAVDDESRTEIAERIQVSAIDEGVIAPVGTLMKPSAFSTRLTGVLDAATPIFWNVSKEE